MLLQLKNSAFLTNLMSSSWLDSKLRISWENNSITKHNDEAIQESIFFLEKQTVSISQQVYILAFSVMLKYCSVVTKDSCSVLKIISVNFMFDLLL